MPQTVLFWKGYVHKLNIKLTRKINKQGNISCFGWWPEYILHL